MLSCLRVVVGAFPKDLSLANNICKVYKNLDPFEPETEQEKEKFMQPFFSQHIFVLMTSNPQFKELRS